MGIIHKSFLFFVFSFADIEAVYINNVIIPDEKVSNKTNAIQLEFVLLNIVNALMIEITRTEMATKIGFMAFIDLIVIADAITMISFLTFDLQNQCSVELLGIFFCVFLFFFSLSMIVLYGIHYIIVLLFLESLLLSVFLYFGFGFIISFGLAGLFVFILIIVCMGGFRISLLVSLARFFGRDF
jgi:hypothetical protein